jgi:peptidoglycan/xylan/chitin deacetylase (PgdA/CDA1 family)
MKAISIMYHDVVETGTEETSGFSGADADLYKVGIERFERDLRRIAEICNAEKVTESNGKNAFHITFDDGGKSAFTQTIDALEHFGWRGHFFIATDFIGTPTFLSESEIIELVARGHVVGSHSASHPLRMSSLSNDELRREWKTSAEKLSDILKKRVTIASVPGGHFSKAVAVTASNAGIETLFTSEPTTGVYQIGATKIFGRYRVQRNTPTETVAAIARGDVSPRLRQYLFWNSKKIIKKIADENYLKIRKRLLAKNYKWKIRL